MLRKIVLTMLILTGWLASGAMAGVISYSSSFNATTLPFGPLALSLPQFNGPADQLRAISFVLEGNIGGALRIENLAGTRVQVSLTGGGAFDLDPPFASPLTVSGPGVSKELDVLDGAVDFFGDSSWSAISEKSFQVSEHLWNPSLFTPYTGTGNFAFNLAANPSSEVISNPRQSVSFLQTAASGTLTVSYFTVPESAPMFLLGLGLLVLSAPSRRSKSIARH